MTGSEYSINRREMLRRAAAASFGVAAPSLIPFSGGTMTLTGLPSEYDKYDALGLAELIAKKEITPAELLDAVRQRVEATNAKINAFNHLFFDKAAEQIQAELGQGPFHGVPFALKDLSQYLKGTITSAGGRIWKDQVADYDRALVTRYKQDGVVFLGETTSVERGLRTSQ